MNEDENVKLLNIMQYRWCRLPVVEPTETKIITEGFHWLDSYLFSEANLFYLCQEYYFIA